MDTLLWLWRADKTWFSSLCQGTHLHWPAQWGKPPVGAGWMSSPRPPLWVHWSARPSPVGSQCPISPRLIGTCLHYSPTIHRPVAYSRKKMPKDTKCVKAMADIIKLKFTSQETNKSDILKQWRDFAILEKLYLFPQRCSSAQGLIRVKVNQEAKHLFQSHSLLQKRETEGMDWIHASSSYILHAGSGNYVTSNRILQCLVDSLSTKSITWTFLFHQKIFMYSSFE